MGNTYHLEVATLIDMIVILMEKIAIDACDFVLLSYTGQNIHMTSSNLSHTQMGFGFLISNYSHKTI
jgi:hypothetical protein